MILDLTRDEDNENILKVSSEIERLLREIESRDSFVDYLGEEAIELDQIEQEMNELRKRKLKILSVYLLRKLSKGNLIIENIIKRNFVSQKPQTYM